MENNLTIEQIQAVIDKGGFLVVDEKKILFGKVIMHKNIRDDDEIWYRASVYLNTECVYDGDSFTVKMHNLREATPEEIEKYVPVEYRPKNMITDTKDTFIGGMNNNIKTHDVQFISPNSYKVKFFATDPDLITSDVQQEVFSKSDLISFGNYLLSKEREEMVTSKPERGIAECAIVIRQVSDADFENWKVKK